jgi:sterol desaturase/sphingolipid hydroxylase (fatty acid hydroxylase superfamily)
VSELDPFWAAFIGFGALCLAAELIRPARKLRYRDQVPLDVVAFVTYQFIMAPLAIRVTDPIGQHVHFPHGVLGLPLAFRVVMFYLAADFGSYWMHRLMHTRHVWRIHRFHHSSKQLYWLSGVRATIPQQILFNIPFIVSVPLLIGAPVWVFVVIVVEGVCRNHWMHVNVTWRSNWIERVFVTPRYHQIHHSSDAKLHDGNYGSLFSIWDRMFGTYIAPDTTKVKKFGTGEAKNDTFLLMIGI